MHLIILDFSLNSTIIPSHLFQIISICFVFIIYLQLRKLEFDCTTNTHQEGSIIDYN